MPDIVFGPTGTATFPTKYHGEVTLSARKWDDICGKPERLYYRHNGDKVATTLITPDYVRYHKHEKGQFLYYKRFETFNLTEGTKIELGIKFMAVIIDTDTSRVCTSYPLLQPKPGREFKPGGHGI